LEPFEEIENYSHLKLGRVSVGKDAWVELEVSGAPCLFWFFVIHRDSDDKTFKVTTGSGSLQTYWPIAEVLAVGGDPQPLLAKLDEDMFTIVELSGQEKLLAEIDWFAFVPPPVLFRPSPLSQ
jgi:hypothetical protein